MKFEDLKKAVELDEDAFYKRIEELLGEKWNICSDFFYYDEIYFGIRKLIRAIE